MKAFIVRNEEEKEALNSLKKRERSLWVGVSFAAVAFFQLLEYLLSKLFPIGFLFEGVVCAAIGAAAFFFWYLQKPQTISVAQPERIADKKIRVKELIFQLDSVAQKIRIYDQNINNLGQEYAEGLLPLIKNTFDRIKTSPYTANLNVVEDENLLHSAIGRTALISRIDQLLNWLKERLLILNQEESINTQDSQRAKDRTRSLVDRTYERLSAEVRQLSTLGNFYLAIGAVATIAAAIYLYSSAPDALKDFYQSNKSHGTSVEISDFVPILIRLSIALVIEIFALYFLKLHREAMGNLKYYQNELTTVDLKAIGLNASYQSNEDNNLKAAVEELVKSERNFILNEKQTTVEIEKSKIEKSSFSEALDKVSGLINKK